MQKFILFGFILSAASCAVNNGNTTTTTVYSAVDIDDTPTTISEPPTVVHVSAGDASEIIYCAPGYVCKPSKAGEQ